MTFIFYLLLIIPLIVELMMITSTKRMFDFISRFKTVSKSKESFTINQKIFALFQVLYMFLTSIGLFSSQRLMFIILIMISLIPKKNMYVLFLDGCFSFLLILFIILNKYHLHLDVSTIILKLFNT